MINDITVYICMSSTLDITFTICSILSMTLCTKLGVAVYTSCGADQHCM
jgi:hypothetical protein